MVLGLAQHARDDLALLGDAQALVGAQRLDVDVAAHGAKVSIARGRVKGRTLLPGICRGGGPHEVRWRGSRSVQRTPPPFALRRMVPLPAKSRGGYYFPFV